MHLDDFNYMWCGCHVAPLKAEQAHWLNPIDIRLRDQGRALLLLHGFSSTPAIYRRFLPTLLQIYDAVVCPALPGHAESIEAFSKATAQAWRDSTKQCAENLAKTYHSLDVMGLSLGGVLAYDLSTSVKLNRLFLLAPAMVLCQRIHKTIVLVKILRNLGIKTIAQHAGNFWGSSYAELTYRRLPLSTVIEVLSYLAAYVPIQSTCPSDVFLGCHDEVVDSNAVEKLLIHQPDTTIHWLEHSAHILPLDGDVDYILECVRKKIPNKKNT